MVTAQRFAQGMTFEQYLAFIQTPENLKREASPLGGGKRVDRAPLLRQWHADTRLSDVQVGAIKWLVAQPKGPAKVLVIAEEWSSDCRRDLPVLQRIAEAGSMELRIFPRDGERFSAAPEPDPKESPNADLMKQFLNRKDGKTFQSIPIAAFYTRDFEHLYTYTEFPAIYHKDRLLGAVRAARAGETPEQTKERGARDFLELQRSPFFRLWGDAAVDEIVTALHERLIVGSLA